MPRKGDKSNIRKWEIPILYSLMTGRSKISYRYLVMMNTWEAGENREKKIIPHCRLITTLLKKFGVVDQFSASTKKDIDPLTLTSLRKIDWLNTETKRYLKVKHKDIGKKLKVLKPDARMLAPGEEDEPDSGDSEVGVSEGENEDEEEVGASSVMQQSSYIISRGIGAEMAKVIQQARTPDWGDFPDFAQVLYDQNTHQGELRRLESQRLQEMLTSLIDHNSRTTTDTL
ncbi:hypothetical protein HanOQP8_Chr13g0502191 [Helianthus annuus]|nr:hypothetical protein HanOQP8_Chr13g0502191 [Helianthus annuus]